MGKANFTPHNLFILAISKKEEFKEKELWNIQMANIMMDSFNSAKETDMEYFITQMEANILECGKMIWNMEKER